MTRTVREQARWLADRLAAQDRKIAGLESRGDLAYSSIEHGTVKEFDLDGNLVSSLGMQEDGSHVPVAYTGPTPDAPSAAQLTAGPGVVEVRWNGKFLDGAVSSMDFKHVAVHASSYFEVDTTPNTQVATIRGELGDVATLLTNPGAVYVRLVAWTVAGKASAPSPVASVVVPVPADSTLIQDALDEMDLSILGIQDSVNGKNQIHNSVDDPATGTGFVSGDRWQKWTTLDVGGLLLASWRHDGTVWVAESMDPTYLPLVDIGQGTFGVLSGGRLEADSVTATSLLVQGPNLVESPRFEKEESWTGAVSGPGVAWDLGTTFGGASRSFLLQQQPEGTPNMSLYAPLGNYIPVVPGDSYRVVSQVRPNGVLPPMSTGLCQQVYFYDASKTFMAGSSGNVRAGSAILTPVASQWQAVGGLVTVPAGAFYMRPRFTAYFDPSVVPNSRAIGVGMVSAIRASDAKLIVDGAVTARTLESELVLASRIIAGDPAATHAEMSPTGFRVFVGGAPGGIPVEVVRMGVASTDDYFAVTQANGTLAATISQDGKISGKDLYASNGLFYKGTEIGETFDSLPKGIVAWGTRGTRSKYWAGGTLQPYLNVSFETPPWRMFRVSTTPITLDCDVESDAVASLHIAGSSTGTAVALPTSTPTSRGISVGGTASTRRSSITFNQIIGGGSSTSIAVLLAYGTLGTGRSKIAGDGVGQRVYITIEDIGPTSPEVGEILDGTSDAATAGTGGGSTAPPPSVKNYYKEYSLTGASSYTGSGSYYAYNESKMYQGPSPAGQGNLTSIACFQSMTGDLAGATITGMRVYLYFEFWYYNAGGTAYLGLHGHSSPPSTFSHSVSGFTASSGWPRPGGRWVDIPSQYWAGFKSGTYKGISLQSPNTLECYGYAAENALISVSYTK